MWVSVEGRDGVRSSGPTGRGDRVRWETFVEAYRRHADAVYGLARSVLGEPRMAENVAVDVFLALWNLTDWIEFSSEELRFFLLGQAYGRAVDRLGIDPCAWQPEHGDGEVGVWDLAMADTVSFDVESPAFELEAGVVNKAMVELSEEQLEALKLAHFGASYQQIASIVGASDEDVKRRLRDGLCGVRTALPGVGMPPNPGSEARGVEDLPVNQSDGQGLGRGRFGPTGTLRSSKGTMAPGLK